MRHLAFILGLVTCLATQGLAEERFELRINDVSGLKEPWPLVGGLPFPEGAIEDPGKIRIIKNGDPVPAQIDVTATWPDGSIRWALAGFTGGLQDDYQVGFGGETESDPRAGQAGLTLEEREDGTLVIDTGVAVYEFKPDRLLPETARIGEVTFLEEAGDGAYLVDQMGRTARVAGEAAEVVSKTLKKGGARVALFREGWYVTDDGEQVARAKAWFYFSAGVPNLKITHSLIFTRDTNELWVRDYGLDFRTPKAPKEVAFAVEETEGEWDYVRVEPAGAEAYLYQDTYPHYHEEEYLAVVGLASDGAVPTPEDGFFWMDDWLTAFEVAGDWGDGRYEDFGLAVVMPHLARRFPKELVFGPESVRAVFWSGRGGRELDFRTRSLVIDHWQGWSELHPGGAPGLAELESDASGTSRTHDVWLMPRVKVDEPLETVEKWARAAVAPPLLQVDPVWLTATEAVGWPLHPKDEERFADQEEVVRNYWEGLMERRNPYAGFIDWGRHVTIGNLNRIFRLSHLVDYGLRTHVWSLYARSGDRDYYDYGTHFNRFAGDWEMADWDVGEKFRGGLTQADSVNHPLYWGNRSTLVSGVTGDDIGNWILEYHLTGDEYAADRVDMVADAFLEHWEPEEIPAIIPQRDAGFAFVRRLTHLYQWTGNEIYREMAKQWLDQLVDFDSPNAITDLIRHGPLYKTDRNIFYMYQYYLATGDETAKRAILQALDYKYRFNRFGLAYSGQSYPALLYAIAYRWTGNPDYLRVVNYIKETGITLMPLGRQGITSNMHPTLALPVALELLAEVGEAIDPFPVVTQFREPAPTFLLFRKDSTEPVQLAFTLRMDEDFLEPEVEVAKWAKAGEGESVEVSLESELAFQPASGSRADPRAWYAEVTMPAEAEEGLYQLNFPRALETVVLSSTAAQTSVYAPVGFQVPRDGVPTFFHVDDDLEALEFFLEAPMEIRRPDGSLALEASSDFLGDNAIPVEGQGGAWSVAALQAGTSIRMFNVEPVFSRSPEWLVSGADVEPEPRFQPPGETIGFVEGLTGQALHLPGDVQVSFQRGDQVEARFENFPAHEGTIEFWFRPNWSTSELTFSGGLSFHDLYFLRAGSHDLQYRRGRDRSGDVAALNLWSYGDETNAGFTGRFLLEAGEWYHIAFVWKTVDGEPGTDGYYAVFVNGEPVEADPRRGGGQRGTAHYWPGRVNGILPLHLREAEEIITIGPLNGTMAQLRISDVARYHEPFTPSEAFEDLDAETILYFPLDGDFEAMEAEVMLEEVK